MVDANNAGLLAMPVQGSDIINVPATGMFFVDGAVRSPGSYPLGRRYSLTQALAIAGGINVDLSSSDITIFRRKSTSGVEPISVDVEAIYAGSVSDPQIEADDMILSPSTVWVCLSKVFDSIAGNFSRRGRSQSEVKTSNSSFPLFMSYSFRRPQRPPPTEQ
jgi:hypothetical protein